jgi:hypothetical protein
MQFYVPTIGDSIFLLEDWSFELHKEGRNLGLAKRFEECGHTKKWSTSHRVYQCHKTWTGHIPGYSWGTHTYSPTYKVVFWHDDSQEAYKVLEDSKCFTRLPDEVRNHSSFEWNGNSAQVVLPRGTELIVDRIYIRGRSREYDSITFRIGKSPANKKLSKARFWVKLKEANRIKCELHPIYDLEAAKLFASDQRFIDLDE